MAAIAPNTPIETDNLEEAGDSEDTQNEEFEEQPDGEVLGATDENQTTYASMKTSYTSEDFFIFLSAIGFINPTEKKTNYCSENSPFPLFTYLLASNS